MTTRFAEEEAGVKAPKAAPDAASIGEGAAQDAASGTLMALFIAGMVLDQGKLEFFMKNPDSRRVLMSSAGLTEKGIGLLTTPCFVELCDHLEKAGVGPAPPDPPPPPVEGG